ncbi:hypothetical protein EDM00_03665 [Ornithobacterium rhinotracheale]|nr:hypothetical protein [Ornithobacterium rhinotracheale]
MGGILFFELFTLPSLPIDTSHKEYSFDLAVNYLYFSLYGYILWTLVLWGEAFLLYNNGKFNEASINATLPFIVPLILFTLNFILGMLS